jgi:ribosomal protein L22
MSEQPRETEGEEPEIQPTPEAESVAAPQGDELQETVDAVTEPAVDDAAQEAAEPADAPVAESDEAADATTETESAGETAGEEATPARRRRRRGSGSGETPAAPAPSRRRPRREPGTPAPVVRAQAKYVRSSARKARLVCDHIRGKSVEEARAILAVTPRAIARDWSKLLESAVANAEHNHELVGEDLYVKAVTADEGPTIKRFQPRAKGRATRIRKRTSHLTIQLTPKD